MTAPALSLILPFYLNSGMLRHQFERMSHWPRKLFDEVEVIIVDDGSPEPAADVPRPAELPRLSIYRVTEDRPWHQHGARNLGAHVSTGATLLLTDMDHVVPAVTLLWCLESTGSRAWMFPRRDAPALTPTLGKDGVSHKPHPNTFAMSRQVWDRVGGYDEDFCGFYGTDSMFRQRLDARAGIAMAPESAYVIRYPREVIPDASTTTLDRNASRRYAERQAVTLKKARDGRTGVPTVLNFPWERVL